jgi:hypothetical protein
VPEGIDELQMRHEAIGNHQFRNGRAHGQQRDPSGRISINLQYRTGKSNPGDVEKGPSGGSLHVSCYDSKTEIAGTVAFNFYAY